MHNNFHAFYFLNWLTDEECHLNILSLIANFRLTYTTSRFRIFFVWRQMLVLVAFTGHSRLSLNQCCKYNPLIKMTNTNKYENQSCDCFMANRWLQSSCHSLVMMITLSFLRLPHVFSGSGIKNKIIYIINSS